MEGNSFTMGYGDCLITDEQKKENVNKVNQYIKKVDQLIRSAYEGVYKPDLDKKYIRESLEVDIKEILGKNFQEIMNDLNLNISKENNLYKAIFSGSKGKKTNIGQILGIVGPQDVWGERIKDGFDDRTYHIIIDMILVLMLKDMLDIHMLMDYILMKCISMLWVEEQVLLILLLKQLILVIFQGNLLKQLKI